jgi:Uma2 family endonuclease
VDNLFSEKQQRLLVESLYASHGGTFLAAANVAIYYARREASLVPDCFVSLDVQVAEDWYAKEHRSYFVWEFGKVPELVVEIVSNSFGDEDTRKLETYARWGVPYYLILDPSHQLGDETLRAYRRSGSKYESLARIWFPELEMGARLWQGQYEDKLGLWLRWIDREGNLLLTGVERAEQERARADMERARAERFAEKLRALGVEPE